ncbi:SIR2 family NAD-dependent protein deacylase [Caminibacter pacificus]|uniref:protein acetyllysine N-acetyltransferase n=1 Tax=Caminibacter pacificus TaxID=1424653 RepID=A0AAJ4RC14_9BACT|nr:Sir2 family NAD-dependent protein deacetylase [Caminibacter pacificus]QCI28008.1 NAD-dependent deacetylase [Caminibacter pacificus]ROR39805.1 NAD-dependent SIR2 family protein deacetylase [Caminibacter pacificus]
MNEIKSAAKAIKEAKYLLITAGAGMGVDSGLPDFRGDEGFWRAYPIAKKLGLNFQALANPRWFDINPRLAWAFYGHRLNLYRSTTPHEGFKILLNMPHEKFVFTSNVDGQFQKAGFSENKIVEIHGSIHYLQCTEPCSDEIWENNEIIEIDMEKFEALNFPYCKECGKIARPNILMFGDFRFVENRVDRQLENFNRWLSKIDDKLVIVEIGAGKAVPTVRHMSERIKDMYQAKLIRINPRESDGADIEIKKGAKEALTMISQYL